MGSISDGAYGEVDVGGGYDSDTLAIMEMNRKADALDANDELNIGASEEDDDMLDFSNPTKGDGSELLQANF